MKDWLRLRPVCLRRNEFMSWRIDEFHARTVLQQSVELCNNIHDVNNNSDDDDDNNNSDNDNSDSNYK